LARSPNRESVLSACHALCLRRGGPEPIFMLPLWHDGVVPDRERRSGKVPGNPRYWRLPASIQGEGVVTGLPWGFSNACAMLQSAFRLTSAIAAPAPRMANNDENRSGGTNGPSTSVITKVKPKTKRPNLYRVLILNDDYTPMEFVVHVLEKFFQKDVEAATKIMLHVHHHGIGECGVFTYEIAETKVTQVMDFARKHQHPLQCVMEKK
jgi:ATP-dependent Clp protease adaptor protein ClpS